MPLMWIKLIAVGVQAFSKLFALLRDYQLVKAGDDAAVARAAAALLERTEAGKAMRLRLAVLDDEEANRLWERMLKP